MDVEISKLDAALADIVHRACKGRASDDREEKYSTLQAITTEALEFLEPFKLIQAYAEATEASEAKKKQTRDPIWDVVDQVSDLHGEILDALKSTLEAMNECYHSDASNVVEIEGPLSDARDALVKISYFAKLLEDRIIHLAEEIDPSTKGSEVAG